MISYRKFNLIFISAIAVSVIINYVIWIFVTQKVIDGSLGDLARIGYFKITPSQYIVESGHKSHMDYKEYIQTPNSNPIDVITVGDSFSNGGGGNYYQAFINEQYNLKVLNIPLLPGKNGIETLLILSNSGILEEIKPRFVILETVERSCVIQYSKKIDFALSMDKEAIKQTYHASKGNNIFPNPHTQNSLDFMNMGNLKYYVYNFLYHFSDHAYFGNVFVQKLRLPFFSAAGDKSTLLFYKDDLAGIAAINATNVKSVNNNLNLLANALNNKGMTLYFMPAVDKYNLYSEYIVNNKYPQSTFFELLRQEQAIYRLIDTKQILAQELKNGEVDVYPPGDTHWSSKGAAAVVKAIRFQ